MTFTIHLPVWLLWTIGGAGVFLVGIFVGMRILNAIALSHFRRSLGW